MNIIQIFGELVNDPKFLIETKYIEYDEINQSNTTFASGQEGEIIFLGKNSKIIGTETADFNASLYHAYTNDYSGIDINQKLIKFNDFLVQSIIRNVQIDKTTNTVNMQKKNKSSKRTAKPQTVVLNQTKH